MFLLKHLLFEFLIGLIKKKIGLYDLFLTFLIISGLFVCYANSITPIYQNVVLESENDQLRQENLALYQRCKNLEQDSIAHKTSVKKAQFDLCFYQIYARMLFDQYMNLLFENERLKSDKRLLKEIIHDINNQLEKIINDDNEENNHMKDKNNFFPTPPSIVRSIG